MEDDRFVTLEKIQRIWAIERVRNGVRKRYIAFQKLLKRLNSLTSARPLSTLKVLDFGTGYFYPYPLMLYGKTQLVVGLDVTPVYSRDGIRVYFQYLLNNEKPIYKVIGSTALKWLERKYYYRELEKLIGYPLEHRAVQLYSYDGIHFPFPDESFDCIISLSVLEHVMDLDVIAKECARVLCHGGILDMSWHNYYSFSGNHMGEKLNLKHPWGHLTGELKTDDKHLNKARPESMQNYFSSSLDVIRVVGTSWDHNIQGEDTGFHYEAEKLLSESMSQRLPEYPRDLLLTVCYLIQAKKE